MLHYFYQLNIRTFVISYFFFLFMVTPIYWNALKVRKPNLKIENLMDSYRKSYGYQL